ncbi:c-di-GMP-binding flagellar brake protein YcgR [Paenibacillus cellulosilyticus]|uniref:C-di-GMP-binding flagellar brake protein YcgR n=1 Tax=Paenibacillus cellulosilyticus TaxID=375489 RepID=A0A2V2YWG8_9BACL|nr:flagellar brake domain-containing protein [Paenibacillus cellulosilyticus]PWW05573.1 c-di-GMP-binding flagellar brake protein YcgR [Paenibacillus cellulosilyticus]QKS45392.1 flagellar brake domain-containing protein [Paenibacillus cellulosilyticus]
MLPKINQMIQFQFIAALQEGKELEFEYKTRIADERDNDFFLEMFIHERTGRFKRPSIGDALTAVYVNEEGVQHFFETQVTGFINDTVPLIRIQKPDPATITKTQRRNYLRVAAALEIAVLTPEGERFNALTDDVGGGGISFICEGKTKLEEATPLECWLLLTFKNGTIEHTPFQAVIVRLNTLATGRLHVMAKFETIADSDRQKIIRYCFERQLDFRNR